MESEREQSTNKTLGRRGFLKWAGAVALASTGATVLASCQSAAPASPAAPAPAGGAAPSGGGASAPAKKAVTVSFWNHQHPPLIDFLKAKMDAYRQKNPNVSFDFQFSPSADHLQKLAVAMGTGTGPHMFDLHSGYTLGFQSKKQMAAAPPDLLGYKSYDEMKADFLPGALDGLTFDGKVYGVPIQSNAFSLFINKKHFQEAGLDPVKDAPKTWDDVARVGKLLVKMEGGRMVRQGFNFGYMLPTWIRIFC